MTYDEVIDVFEFNSSRIIKKNISKRTLLKDTKVIGDDFNNNVTLYGDENRFIIVSKNRAVVFRKSSPEFHMIKLLYEMKSEKHL